MKLNSITVSGYKGLKSVNLEDLSNVNFLVGKNASGKSSVLECLQILSKHMEGMEGSSQNIIGFTKYSLSKDLKIEIKYDSGLSLACLIPKNTSIDNNSFSVYPDNVSINGSSVTQVKKDKRINSPNRREIFETISGQIFMSKYISSFTEQIDNPDYVIKPDHLIFNFNNVDEFTDDDLLLFLNKYYPLESRQVIDDISSSIRGDKAIQFQISDKESKDHLFKVAFSQLSGGLRSITRLYFGIIRIIKSVLTKENIQFVICIEEPENGFHPSFQKQIPMILNDFTKQHPQLMFIVTTHSPFIISSATSFKDQKIYIFDGGSLVSLDGKKVESSIGYSQKNCLNVIAKMLEVGFSDLSEMPTTHESLKLVYCEGQKKETRDSLLYQHIFQDISTVFISSGGIKAAIHAYHLAKEASKFIFGNNTRVIALVDRSCSSESIQLSSIRTDRIEKTTVQKPIFTTEERERFLASDSDGGLKMLIRKEIENYIFDPIVVNLLPTSDKGKILKASVEIDYLNGEVKDHIKTSPEIKIKLADLIYQHKNNSTKKIYDELFHCLYDEK